LLPRGLRAQIGEIFEWRADQTALELGRRVKHAEGAALVIDYAMPRARPAKPCRPSASTNMPIRCWRPGWST